MDGKEYIKEMKDLNLMIWEQERFKMNVFLLLKQENIKKKQKLQFLNYTTLYDKVLKLKILKIKKYIEQLYFALWFSCMSIILLIASLVLVVIL